VSDPEFDPRPSNEGRNGPGVFLVLVVLVAAVIAVFIAQNADRAPIEFLFFDFNSRIWVAITIAIALGVLLDRVIIMWWRRARKRKHEA
jgi:uncharacterized integral membrane protein